MKVKAVIFFEFDKSVESGPRAKMEKFMKEKGIPCKDMFLTFARYIISAYMDEPSYEEIMQLERELAADYRKMKIDFEAQDVYWSLFNWFPEYTEEEHRKAVGYYLANMGWGAVCDVIDEQEDDFGWCETCGECTEQRDSYVFEKTAKIKRWNEKGVRKVFETVGDFDTAFVSVAMYEYLLENGIPAEHFLPAHTGKRRKKIAGYQIVGNVLEPGLSNARSIGLSRPVRSAEE